MENPLLWARTLLTTTPNRWLVLTGSLPPEMLALRPAESEWSAVECLQHIIDVEKIFQYRVSCFMESRDFPAFNPDTEGSSPEDKSPSELALEFETLREHSLQVLEHLVSSELNRRVRHQELGPVTLGEMIHEWAAHDLNHTVQAERSLMQPFILGSGPWSVYFSEHRINP